MTGGEAGRQGRAYAIRPYAGHTAVKSDSRSATNGRGDVGVRVVGPALWILGLRRVSGLCSCDPMAVGQDVDSRFRGNDVPWTRAGRA